MDTDKSRLLTQMERFTSARPDTTFDLCLHGSAEGNSPCHNTPSGDWGPGAGAEGKWAFCSGSYMDHEHRYWVIYGMINQVNAFGRKLGLWSRIHG